MYRCWADRNGDALGADLPFVFAADADKFDFAGTVWKELAFGPRTDNLSSKQVRAR